MKQQVLWMLVFAAWGLLESRGDAYELSFIPKANQPDSRPDNVARLWTLDDLFNLDAAAERLDWWPPMVQVKRDNVFWSNEGWYVELKAGQQLTVRDLSGVKLRVDTTAYRKAPEVKMAKSGKGAISYDAHIVVERKKRTANLYIPPQVTDLAERVLRRARHPLQCQLIAEGWIVLNGSRVDRASIDPSRTYPVLEVTESTVLLPISGYKVRVPISATDYELRSERLDDLLDLRATDPIRMAENVPAAGQPRARSSRQPPPRIRKIYDTSQLIYPLMDMRIQIELIGATTHIQNLYDAGQVFKYQAGFNEGKKPADGIDGLQVLLEQYRHNINHPENPDQPESAVYLHAQTEGMLDLMLRDLQDPEAADPDLVANQLNLVQKALTALHHRVIHPHTESAPLLTVGHLGLPEAFAAYQQAISTKDAGDEHHNPFSTWAGVSGVILLIGLLVLLALPFGLKKGWAGGQN